MTIWIDRDGTQKSIANEILHTEKLLTDMKRFALKQFPNSRELEMALLLDDYKINVGKFAVLSGLISNNQRSRIKFTSSAELYAIAPTLGWARTRTSFYRLGFPYE